MAKEKKKLKVQSADRWIKESKTSGSGKWLKTPQGVTFFNPKEVKPIKISVVPYEVTEKGNPNCDPGFLYGERKAWCHFGIGPNQGSYVCNAKTYNTKCPVCEYRANLMKKGGDEEHIKSLIPKERQLWNVVDHRDEAKGVQLWDISIHLFGKFLINVIDGAEPEEKERFQQYLDPEEGCVIKATPIAKPNGKGGTFNEFSNVQLIPRTKPLAQEWLDAALNLDKLVPPVDYDELKKIFLQTEDEAIDDDEDNDKDDSDDDDDKPVARNGKAKPKAKDDDEDDEDSDDDDDDPSAEDMGIEVGTVVTHKKWGTCKVTKVSGDGTSVRVKDKNGKGEERNGIAPKDPKVVKEDEDEDDDEDDDDDKPAAKKPAGKKVVAEDDDDEPLDDADDDDEDEEDDDEPVKKPTAKKPAAKVAADDDDDDDEPAPKRGRGRPPGSKNKK
jgi:hypothetical protein